MKVKDMIEALQTANGVFRKKHKCDLEIFDMQFSEDGYDGDMHIQGVGEVKYESNSFGYGSKRGLHPSEDIRIHFQCEDEKIVDRSVTLDEAPQ